jgi:hypothetical protein
MIDIELLHDLDPELVTMDGYDEAIMGTITLFGKEPVVLYDREKVIELIMEKDDCSYDDALEHHEYNQAQVYAGERTPAFFDKVE